MKQTMDIVLASGSPRRKELLERIGLQFEITKSDKEELVTKSIPSEVVMELASMKALDVAEGLENQKDCMIIGADTIVVLDHQILGKPKDEENALEILMSLSGKAHSVYTGVCVIVEKDGTREITTFAEETKVHMYPFTKEAAKEYIATKEPMDKAGAYGIQGIGSIFVEKIDGDYNNVVGFPLAAFVKWAMEKNYFMI